MQEQQPRSILDIEADEMPYQPRKVVRRQRQRCVFCGGWMFQAIDLETRQACRDCRHLGLVEAKS